MQDPAWRAFFGCLQRHRARIDPLGKGENMPNGEEEPARLISALNEEDLEAELTEANTPVRKWNLAWVNKPITLWILTTCAVGLLGFIYTNYDTCLKEKSADTELIRSNNEEIISRIVGARQSADNFVKSFKTSKEYWQTVQAVETLTTSLEPANSYRNSKYKDIWADEIANQVITIENAWNYETGIARKDYLIVAGIRHVHERGVEFLHPTGYYTQNMREEFLNYLPEWREILQQFRWDPKHDLSA
jgi:hypothetical protein